MNTTYIYESPDKGSTITRRPFGGELNERETIKTAMSKKSDREYLNIVLTHVLAEAGDSQVNLASEAARKVLIQRINELLDR